MYRGRILIHQKDFFTKAFHLFNCNNLKYKFNCDLSVTQFLAVYLFKLLTATLSEPHVCTLCSNHKCIQEQQQCIAIEIQYEKIFSLLENTFITCEYKGVIHV